MQHTGLVDPELAIRVNRTNPDHHLWNNNGTWFIHYTVYPDPCTKARIRESLRTKRLEQARRRRDRILRSAMRQVAS